MERTYARGTTRPDPDGASRARGSVRPVPDDVLIEAATTAAPDLVAAFAALIPQLSKSSPPPGADELDEMIRSSATDVLVARDAGSGAILGSLVLVVFRIPTGVR